MPNKKAPRKKQQKKHLFVHQAENRAILQKNPRTDEAEKISINKFDPLKKDLSVFLILASVLILIVVALFFIIKYRNIVFLKALS